MNNNNEPVNTVPLLDYSSSFIQRRTLSQDDWEAILSQEGPFKLDLAYTNVTDEDLKKLENKDGLRFLCLVECRLLTKEGIESLQSRLPECRIEVSPKNTDHSVLRAISTILFICGLAGILAWSTYEKPEKEKGDPNTVTTYYYPPDENDTALKKLATKPDLQVLVLKEGCQVDEEGYRAIASLKHLKILVLWAVTPTGKDLEILSQSKTIEDLYLNGERITDSGLAQLAAFESLKHFYILKAVNISDDGLAELKNIPKLSILNISGSRKITNEGMKHIAACKNVTILSLESCPTVTDEGMEYLASMENLREIGLERMEIGTEGFTYFLKSPKLVKVSLGSNKINDEVLAVVGKIPQLSMFAMTNSFHVTDKGLLHITDNPQLTSLMLGACLQITADGLKPLKKHGQLVSLHIVSCISLDDKIFDCLPASLKTCYLGNSDEDHYTSRAINRFKRTHPDCKVTRVPVHVQPL